MTLTIHNVAQRSSEWFEARRGIVTASAVGKLITVRKLGAGDFACPSCEAPANEACRSSRVGEMKTFHKERTAVSANNKTRVMEVASNDDSRSLTAALVAERINGFTDPSYTTFDMWRGIDTEPRARDAYAKHFGVKVEEVGLMVEDKWGFKIGLSPDGLVGDDGLIEVKGPRSKGHVLTVVSDSVPFEHLAQIQCALLVSGREWCDFISAAGGMHLYPKRIYPDPAWQKVILAAVRAFEDNAAEMLRIYQENVAGMPLLDRLPEYDATPELKLA